MTNVEKYGKKLGLDPGRISNEERAHILEELGILAQIKYDEYVINNGRGYNLQLLKGSLHFEKNIEDFSNKYWLEGANTELTNIANYFEYGTGIHNTKRAGKYRAGYIKPVTAEYLQFMGKKSGQWVKTDRVKGVKPVFAMTKALAFIEQNRTILQRAIRWEYKDG